jgi:hypothetical protein
MGLEDGKTQAGIQEDLPQVDPISSRTPLSTKAFCTLRTASSKRGAGGTERAVVRSISRAATMVPGCTWAMIRRRLHRDRQVHIAGLHCREFHVSSPG